MHICENAEAFSCGELGWAAAADAPSASTLSALRVGYGVQLLQQDSGRLRESMSAVQLLLA